ncbi:MAG: ABC transporter ATP-binding protein [Actinomycetota bacterium]|nr:ABC transporter ATP-binding protein [Actinomycetota bacterium]
MPELDTYLEAEDVTVRFGGLTAVDQVTIGADRGEIVGVIGPNGAGKTTLFGAIAGTVRTEQGRVRLGDHDVTGWSSHRRARAGLARTFQRLEVFGSMTVRENLAYATEARALGSSPLRLLSRNRHRRLDVVDDLLEQLGLAAMADERAADLPPGTARVLELGRALCADPELLLLDEPSSGLDVNETMALADHVVDAVRTRGVGVVLIEHDMSMVLTICERLYVLDFGQCIAAGPTAEVAALPVVRDAYLGTGHG